MESNGRGGSADRPDGFPLSLGSSLCCGLIYFFLNRIKQTWWIPQFVTGKDQNLPFNLDGPEHRLQSHRSLVLNKHISTATHVVASVLQTLNSVLFIIARLLDIRKPAQSRHQKHRVENIRTSLGDIDVCQYWLPWR